MKFQERTPQLRRKKDGCTCNRHAGYIGSHTCVELINAGQDVVILDNFYNCKHSSLDRIRALVDRDFKFYECDIRDREGLNKVFETEDIDCVIHFAGLKAVGESVHKPLEYFDNNVNGTLVLLDVMRHHGCKKIIFSSSATVYGMNNIAPLYRGYGDRWGHQPLRAHQVYDRVHSPGSVCERSQLEYLPTAVL